MEISIDNLSESAPEDIRRATMEQIIRDDGFDLAKLIRPLKREDCWHFCALTIHEIKNELLYRHTYEMLKWLQDITWPGAVIVMEKLATFPPNILEPNLIKAKHAAELTEDSFWMYSMYMILEKAIAKRKWAT